MGIRTWSVGLAASLLLTVQLGPRYTKPAETSFDPSTTAEWMEEFNSGTATSGQIGTHGWSFANLVSGTNSFVDADAQHPGQWRYTSSASNNSGVIGSVGANGIGARWPDFGSNGAWTIDFLYQMGANSTGVTTIGFYAGLAIVGGSDVTNTSHRFGVRFDTNRGDTTFIFQMCNAAGAAGCDATGDDTNSKVVASTVTPAQNTWYRIRLRRDPTGGPSATPLFGARVNNETELTWCSSGCSDTIVTPVLYYPQVQYVTRTTSSTRSGDLDYFRIKITGMSRY